MWSCFKQEVMGAVDHSWYSRAVVLKFLNRRPLLLKMLALSPNILAYTVT